MKKFSCQKKEKCVEVIQILGEEGPPGPVLGDFIFSASDTDPQIVISTNTFQDIVLTFDYVVDGWERLADTFITPDTGVYQISYAAILGNLGNNTAQAILRVVRNGQLIEGSQINLFVQIGELEQASKTFLVELNEGDIIEFQFLSDSSQLQLIGPSVSGLGSTNPFTVSIIRIK